MTTATVTVMHHRKPSGPELEIDRLAGMNPAQLHAADLGYLKAIRDCRSSLLVCENELSELREARKLKKEALEQAIVDASTHFDNRQMALNFGGER